MRRARPFRALSLFVVCTDVGYGFQATAPFSLGGPIWVSPATPALLRLGATATNEISNARATSASLSTASAAGKSRVNGRVRAIMDLLVARYGDSKSPDFTSPDASTRTSTTSSLNDWTKMRRFLYRATTKSKDNLTVNQVVKLVDFLNETFPDDIDLQRSILMQSPRIVSKTVATQLQPTVDFLRSLYGPTLFLYAVTRNPDLLLTTGTGYKGDALDLVEVFLRQDLHLSASHIRQLKQSSPALFQLSMVQLLSVVSYLRSILEVQPLPSSNAANDPGSSITDASPPSFNATATIAKLILTHPSIFQLSVTDNLRPRLEYFQARLGLSNVELAGWIKSSSGAVLGLSVTHNLAPTLDLLSSILSPSALSQGTECSLRKALASHPQILGLSLPNLQAKIDYLNGLDNSAHGGGNGGGGVGAVDKSLAARVLLRAPTVFSLSLSDNIMPTVNFLARIWGCCDCDSVAVTESKTSRRNIAPLLSEYPSILTLSLEGNIQPTVNFYVRSGYLALDDAGRLDVINGKGFIVRGRYIAASLHTRLLPRWNYYCERAKKQQPQQNDHGGAPFVPPPIHVLAATTDEAFCEKCGFDYTLYMSFKQKAIPRLKFSSQFDTWLTTGRPIDV